MVKSNINPGLFSGGLTNDLRDIRPPVEIVSAWFWVSLAAGALLLAALAVWGFKMWLKRRSLVPPVPVVPPHVRAKQKLQEALALLGQPRPFCILVSDTLRGYLEERFSFRAPERTTEEFLHELQGTPLLTPRQKESLGEFLKRCDLVKFARYEPREPELRDLHECALNLVTETEPAPPPGETSPGSPPPAVPAGEPRPSQPAAR